MSECCNQHPEGSCVVKCRVYKRLKGRTALAAATHAESAIFIGLLPMVPDCPAMLSTRARYTAV